MIYGTSFTPVGTILWAKFMFYLDVSPLYTKTKHFEWFYISGSETSSTNRSLDENRIATSVAYQRYFSEPGFYDVKQVKLVD